MDIVVIIVLVIVIVCLGAIALAWVEENMSE